MYEELEKEAQNVIRVHFPIERSLRYEHGKEIQDMFEELEEICTAGVNAKRKSLIFGRATGRDLVEAVCQRLDSNEALCPIFREALEAYDFKVFELEKPVSRISREAVIRDFNASSSNVVLIANLLGLGSYRRRARVAQTAARVVYLLQGYRSPRESTIIGRRFGDATLKTFLAKDTIEERRLMHIDNQSYFELVIPARNEYAFLTKLAKIKM
ncbi:hypothetical protein ACJIZ3_011254 [Penstemon smallii]|uniref:Uncharacterized protein n=1 Tax=Penstemon smallii TaxID=265156 RepID=A0ABD3UK00_9LAMI